MCQIKSAPTEDIVLSAQRLNIKHVNFGRINFHKIVKGLRQRCYIMERISSDTETFWRSLDVQFNLQIIYTSIN